MILFDFLWETQRNVRTIKNLTVTIFSIVNKSENSDKKSNSNKNNKLQWTTMLFAKQVQNRFYWLVCIFFFFCLTRRPKTVKLKFFFINHYKQSRIIIILIIYNNSYLKFGDTYYKMKSFQLQIWWMRWLYYTIL